jgi:hypothetical protein
MASKTTHDVGIRSDSAISRNDGGFSVEMVIFSPKGNSKTYRVAFDQWDVRALAELSHQSLDQAEQAIRSTRDALCGDEV